MSNEINWKDLKNKLELSISEIKKENFAIVDDLNSHVKNFTENGNVTEEQVRELRELIDRLKVEIDQHINNYSIKLQDNLEKTEKYSKYIKNQKIKDDFNRIIE